MPEARFDSRAERRLLVRKWWRHGREIAAFTPSSTALAVATCAYLDPTRPQVVLELGAGTGPITRAAAKQLHPQSRLIAVERDPDLAAMLAETVPAAEAVVGDASELAGMLAERNVTGLDVVLSGLPMPSLPTSVRQRVLDAIAACAGDPVFSQITVMPWVYRPLYRRLFRSVRFVPVWRNLPPGGVYHCRGIRGAALE
ncbi:methyltransferase domain-containing protein [Spiribacter halobius]|uniref:Ribose ABC transporter permease n=1 Tax=Sediminicurvatus halobius TaxID=2182432 RepID=A0A2U2N1W8_9GAMM|nr:methyltransferase domain-containing protein [Spiribacter halobius]PWG62984.1 ribose ABC transporter permease [Spiribacter halobius]UEX77500.1 methyltransferase domain-containing protein [Spiribacter halobius]